MIRLKLLNFLALPVLLISCGPTSAQTPPLPAPVLYLTGLEYYEANGRSWVRHRYDVLNKDVYPAEMFDAAPNLPPCGQNANSSRSWVDIFNANGQRLYGFCALGNPANLGSIWFATEEGTIPPSWVYIEIIDRQTNQRYRSNLAETVP
jgi:hypothetical protein